MIIHLNEIPEDGKSFEVDSRSGELNSILEDLIGKIPHKAEFFIKPVGNSTYELIGTIKTESLELCSRCGHEFKFPINEAFKELMMPSLPHDRGDKYSKINHFSDSTHEGPSVYDINGNDFNAGEYLHEIVGLAIPFNPAPPCDSKGKCHHCHLSIQDHNFSYSEKSIAKESPFSVLKKLNPK